MQNYDARGIIQKAIQRVTEISPQQTDGKWLEELTVWSAHIYLTGSISLPTSGVSGLKGKTTSPAPPTRT